jgi:putative transposase
MILGLVRAAMSEGARQSAACDMLGIDPRTVERWKAQQVGMDRRAGPRRTPSNKLTEVERGAILKTVNQPEYADRSPKEIVPMLADQGLYLGSESSIYRILRAQGQLTHRAASRPAKSRPPREHVVTGPNQVWSWDITYLRSPVAGVFFYLYLVVDVWSRKTVAAAVHATENGEHASNLIEAACRSEGVDPKGLVLHADNGGPMKGATLLVTLQRLGIMPSFSRPHVSDDNPFSEALFRTVKYHPSYPGRPFPSLQDARAWVDRFVTWYNYEHHHSAIKFVTPAQRHSGKDTVILGKRTGLYREARKRNPARWSRSIRDWSRVEIVRLNPARPDDSEAAA